MIKRMAFASFAAIGLLGLALVVGAQGPRGPRERGDFGAGAQMGGGGHCTAPCTEYQFKYKRVSTQPFLVNGSASPITTTTTGVIARNSNGSTYDEATLSGGPWGGQSGPQEIIFIRNLDPAVMMSYIENVTKKTYEEREIKLHASGPNGGSRPNWPGPGKGPNNGASSGGSSDAPTRTTIANYPISDSTYICPTAEKTSSTHTIQLPGSGGSTTITSNEIYCLALQLPLEKDRSDPRFGTSSYTLSNYLPSPASSVSFAPDPSFTLSKGRNFGPGPGGPGKKPFGPGH